MTANSSLLYCYNLPQPEQSCSARCWAAVYHDVVILSYQTKVSGCNWVSCSKIVQAGRTRAFLGVVFVDFLIYHSATTNHWWKLEASFELWTILVLRASQSLIPRECWNTHASKLDPVHSAPAMQVPSAWAISQGSEGKVTHKVGPLGSFYMWGPYKRPHKWVTYKNWLPSEKKHIR